MRVTDYLAVAHKTDRLPTGDIKYDINPRLGLAGEIGFLLSQLKKEVRENRPTADATRAAIKDELGDILWYSVTIAHRARIDFQKDVLFQNLVRVQSGYSEENRSPAPLLKKVLEPGGEVSEALKKGPGAAATFSDYQVLAVKTSKYKNNRETLVPYLAQIWKNAGELLSPFGPPQTKDTVSHGDKAAVARSLGDIMWYVAGFAHLYKLSLDEIAEINKEKILSAFPAKSQRIPTPLYDEGHGPLEQFPRRFNVDFVERDPETAVMLINGVRVGDPLTDNAYTTENGDRQLIDGYRFHDSIHLAFVAILGWSPVIRGLMKRKRKSLKEIDEVEDGARAQIVEEMIVKIAHSHAVGFHRDKLLDKNKYINLNFLKDIKMLSEGLEVAGGRNGAEACKYWEWERAILEGFRIYNLLRRNRRGRIIVDLNKRSVKFIKITKSQGTRMPVTNL